EDNARFGAVEDHLRVAVMEDVLVFVVRRAVADQQFLLLDRPERQFLEESPVRRAEMLARPERGGLRRVVELLAFFVAGDDAVVVAADVQLARLPVTHGVEDLVWLRAVADEIAEADDAMKLLAAHAIDHRAQRLGV